MAAIAPSSLDELMNGVTAERHLDRQRTILRFKATLRDLDNRQEFPTGGDVTAAAALAETLFGAPEWESRQGSMALVHTLLKHPEASAHIDAELRSSILNSAMYRLEDGEVRVREAVGDLLEALACIDGISVWQETKEPVLESIQTNFDRGDDVVGVNVKVGGGAGDHDHDHEHGHHHGGATGEQGEDDKTTDSETESTYEAMMHDTEGWRALETSFKCLQKIILGTGSGFGPEVGDHLIGLLFRALEHTNRFVRETGYLVFSSLCSILEQTEIHRLAESLVPGLGRGLADNWSQVRFAASVATRHFCLNVDQRTEDEALEVMRAEGEAAPSDAYMAVLIPRMCLNRYYVAEGVKNFSLHTWRLVMGRNGRALIAAHIDAVVEFYVSQSEADNHAVREAACKCIAEMGERVDPAAVRPHVRPLLDALMMCFRDQSWPVRDSACSACAVFVSCFPEECRASLDELYDLWFKHLSDNINSVRENTAVALRRVVDAYGDEALERVCAKLVEALPKAKEQTPAVSTAHGGLSNTTTFGVAYDKHAHDNDPEIHANQVMFSCGSLAPKLKRGAGCMDHGFSRPEEPWESTDGALYLLRELSAAHPDLATTHMPTVVDVADLGFEFPHRHNLLETIWKAVPVMAANAGQDAARGWWDSLAPPLFATMQRDNQLARAAAYYAYEDLKAAMGEAWTADHVTADQVAVADACDFHGKQ